MSIWNKLLVIFFILGLGAFYDLSLFFEPLDVFLLFFVAPISIAAALYAYAAKAVRSNNERPSGSS